LVVVVVILLLVLILRLSSVCLCHSLFATEAIESKSRDSVTCIYGCDSSRVMSQMAVDIVSQSRYSQLINIINKKSTELQCPQDFPAKLVTADSRLVLVTEVKLCRFRRQFWCLRCVTKSDTSLACCKLLFTLTDFNNFSR